MAESNLDGELSRLREAGATADGAVGDPNPMVAIETTIAHGQFDEIILSTLPPRHLPLARDGSATPHPPQTNIPVTVITAPK